MTQPHDRQLEHELDLLGDTLVERASEAMPMELDAALARKRRGSLTRWLALAAALVLVAAGAFVVYSAANAWAPAVPKPQIVHRDPPKTTPAPVESVDTPFPQSIASLKGAWQRTGEADPPAMSGSGEQPFRAGDVSVRARLEDANSPLR